MTKPIASKKRKKKTSYVGSKTKWDVPEQMKEGRSSSSATWLMSTLPSHLQPRLQPLASSKTSLLEPSGESTFASHGCASLRR